MASIRTETGPVILAHSKKPKPILSLENHISRRGTKIVFLAGGQGKMCQTLIPKSQWDLLPGLLSTVQALLAPKSAAPGFNYVNRKTCFL